jgi:hypothetical protein
MVIWIILLLYLIKIYQVLVCSWILQIQKIQVPWSHLSVHQHRSSCQSLARRVLPPHCRMVRHQHRIRCLVPHGILHVKLPWIRHRLLDPLRWGGGASNSSTSPTASAAPNFAPNPTPSPSSEVAPTRPRTRLQGGIRKPKIYTDGTIKYGFLATSEEPHSL